MSLKVADLTKFSELVYAERNKRVGRFKMIKRKKIIWLYNRPFDTASVLLQFAFVTQMMFDFDTKRVFSISHHI